MNQPEKGMTTEEASSKKKSGHKNEEHFAGLIGGKINATDHTRKQNVHDLKHGWRYSVKSGKKWQIFLYARSRLEENTIIKAIGNISSLLIECIDILPSDRNKREENPAHYKELLKVPMEKLAREL